MLIAFPIAYYMARVARPRTRAVLFMLVPAAAVGELSRPGLRLAGDPRPERTARLGPRAVRARAGRARARPTWDGDRVHLSLAAVHDPADLRRARADPALAARGVGAISARGGATTFRRVVLPLVLPALAAGSIFTFSLTLGDYITPQPRLEQPVHRQRRLRATGRRRQPARSPPRSPSCRSRSWPSTCSSPAGSARSRRSDDGRWLAARRVATAAVLAFLYLPIAIIALYAFNAQRIQVWPIREFSTEWFGVGLGQPVGPRRARPVAPGRARWRR